MKVLVLHYIEPEYRDFFNSEDLLRELFKHLRRHPGPVPVIFFALSNGRRIERIICGECSQVVIKPPCRYLHIKSV